MLGIKDHRGSSAWKPRSKVERAVPQPKLGGVVSELDGVVHVLTCGSVDDGKSTLIGRLLWDAGDLPEDTRATLARSAGSDGQPDLSLLVDGLVAEREQGITIDIAWRYFDTNRRRLVIIDSPGHEQYTRNMASGASHADVAVMLVDARSGVKRQTKRHAAILDLVGVKRVILAVNKMDLVGWSEERFRAIEAEFKTLLAPFHFVHASAIPVAAKPGDNIALRSKNMPWYRGATLLEELNAVPGRSAVSNGTFRMPVQTVVRDGHDFRGLAGTISSGTVRPGDIVRDTLSGREANVRRIVTMGGDLNAAITGQAVVLELDRDLDISRGAVLASADAAIKPATQIEARLVWLADTSFDPKQGLLLRTAADIVPVTSMAVQAHLDLETLDEIEETSCTANDIVSATVHLGRTIAVDTFAVNRETGTFVLVDALTGATLAGGVIRNAAQKMPVEDGATFKLTAEMLARGICAGLEPGTLEFRHRAEEAAILLTTAGVAVVLEIA